MSSAKRVAWAGLGLLVVVGLLPRPTPALDLGEAWLQTATLHGAAPQREKVERGSPYLPVLLVPLDYALGWDLDPSGATAVRTFDFADEQTARTAAAEAIAVGRRTGFAMQSPDGQVWRVTDRVWGDDGWNATRDVRFAISVLAEPARGWTVHLLLERTY